MILRDRNHPSVVIWSLGNEIVEDGSYAQRGAQMAALLRSLDRTPPADLGRRVHVRGERPKGCD